jgi:hypothetical protein
MKKISLLVVASGEADNLLRLVRSALTMAADKSQVQVVIAAAKDDALSWHYIHKLYSEYPVELFDPVQQTTIKAISWDYTRPSAETYENLEARADGYAMVIVENDFYFTDQKIWQGLIANAEQYSWDSFVLQHLKNYADHQKFIMPTAKGTLLAYCKSNYKKLKLV